MDQRQLFENKDGTYCDALGKQVTPPEGWLFLPAGDAGITRKVTKTGNFWRVCYLKGKRTYTKGIWAPAALIRLAQSEMEAIRQTDQYKKRVASSRLSRERTQALYVGDFKNAIIHFLAFHDRYSWLAKRMAELITQHATPVGSGTVARTATIPIEERCRKAVIAWMRHQTTAYDTMCIQRVKGRRREVRSNLAKQSLSLIQVYRDGDEPMINCPLMQACSFTH